MSQNIATIGFGVIAAVIMLFAVLVLWKIFTNAIDISDLLTETPAPGTPAVGGSPAPAKASLSRFQFLVFTFVIASLFLLLSIEAGTFVDIPQNVLVLLGISGGSYVASKTINAADRSDKNGKNGDPQKPKKPKTPQAGGHTSE